MRYVLDEEKFILDKTCGSNVTLVINSSKINIDYKLEDGDFSVLIFNNVKGKVELLETGDIKNASVNITYLDLNDENYYQENKINVYKGSNLNINSIYLGVNNKRVIFNITNLESDSDVKINNNVVCLNNAEFVLDVIGNIKKGAKRSKCHQSSRCLTFEDPKIAKVLPVLNIDENDVEASHSLSSGTIDEDVLFYMNARGLNKKEALKLLLVSYLMPSEEFYKEFDALDLKQIAENKVNVLC